MRNICLTLQFEGTAYCGWQAQQNGESVQQTVERALEPILGAPVRLRGSGRTDSGVHAEGQVANFLTDSSRAPSEFMRSANANLPDDIAVTEAEEKPLDFDARRDAKLRWYRYRIAHDPAPPVFDRARMIHLPHGLDTSAMLAGLQGLSGHHDFRGFRSVKCDAERTVLDLDCEANFDAGPWTIDFRCRSFLHNMVRIIVGTMLECGRGKIGPEDIAEVFASGKRHRLMRTAPARGLTLMAVYYNADRGMRIAD